MVFFYGFVPVYGKLREFRLRVLHEYLIRSRLRENYPDREQSGAAKAGSRGKPRRRYRHPRWTPAPGDPVSPAGMRPAMRGARGLIRESRQHSIFCCPGMSPDDRVRTGLLAVHTRNYHVRREFLIGRMDLVPPAPPDNRKGIIPRFLSAVRQFFSGFPFVMWLSGKPDKKKED